MSLYFHKNLSLMVSPELYQVVELTHPIKVLIKKYRAANPINMYRPMSSLGIPLPLLSPCSFPYVTCIKVELRLYTALQ